MRFTSTFIPHTQLLVWSIVSPVGHRRFDLSYSLDKDVLLRSNHSQLSMYTRGLSWLDGIFSANAETQSMPIIRLPTHLRITFWNTTRTHMEGTCHPLVMNAFLKVVYILDHCLAIIPGRLNESNMAGRVLRQTVLKYFVNQWLHLWVDSRVKGFLYVMLEAVPHR